MKTALSIIFIITLAVGVFLFSRDDVTQASANKDQTEQLTNLPWQIKIDSLGRSNIFGITLGESSLLSLEEHFSHPAEIHLFRNRDDSLSVEAYFNKITLSHIDSRVIVELDLAPDTLENINASASKPKIMPSGTYRFTLRESDRPLLRNQTIISLTYAPVYLKLNEDVIQARFGKYEQAIKTSDGNTHLLYPEKGLDIVRSAKGKLILQYVSPHDFNRLIAKLPKVD